MQERLAERLDRWKADINKKCREEVEDKAASLTDSIIIANAAAQRSNPFCHKKNGQGGPSLPERFFSADG